MYLQNNLNVALLFWELCELFGAITQYTVVYSIEGKRVVLSLSTQDSSGLRNQFGDIVRIACKPIARVDQCNCLTHQMKCPTISIPRTTTLHQYPPTHSLGSSEFNGYGGELLSWEDLQVTLVSRSNRHGYVLLTIQ